MAIAGLHKASTSSIRKMWRELESEGRVGENGRRKMSGVRIGNEGSCSSSLGGERVGSEGTSRDANGIENECPRNQIRLKNRQEDTNTFDVPERERMRKIFREWGSKSFGGHTSYNSSRVNNCSRSRWIGENECKRVRIVSDRIELSTQQRDGHLSGLEEPATEIGSQIEEVQDGSRRPIRRIYGRQALLDLLKKFEWERETELESLLENRFVSNFAHRHRIQSSLKGRFLRNQRFVEDEKQISVAANELGVLRQTQAVSDIRKGFLSRLNNHDHAPDGTQSDSDTSFDNDMIEQSEEIVHEIPDETGEEFETTNLAASGWEACNPQEFTTPVEERHESEEPPLTVELTETRSQHLNHSAEETNHNVYHTELSHDPLPEVDEVMLSPSTRTEELQESSTEYDDDEGGWHHLTRIGSDVNLNENELGWYQESHEEWYDNTLEDTTESWLVGNSYQEAAPVDRSYAFYSSDDDNGRSRFELGELTSRRTVSNLLQSDFGARLNQLLQSYVNRQDPIYDSENEYENPGGNPSTPVVILQAESNNDLQGAADINQHYGTERDIINGLRIDMDMLQQRMNDMQRMLEACMGMQLQLQRSVQQEVSSALNRSLNSGEGCEDGKQNYDCESSHGKGVCFLCCEDGFDSLPNKSSAHMYICSKCAEKVNWSQLKESVRHP